MALVFLGFASPAQAADTYVYGTKVSASSVPNPGNAGSFLGDVNRTSCIYKASGIVRFSDDAVFVADQCADGTGAAARVGWKVNGIVYSYRCVNNFGAGTIAMCDLNWPEGGAVVKTLVAGLNTPSSVPGQWQWGTYVSFAD
jgi:hypothetical protein